MKGHGKGQEKCMKDNTLNITRLKQIAKKIKKEHAMSQAKALDAIAQEYGFANWQELQREADKQRTVSRPTPAPSTDFFDDDSIIWDESDYQVMDQERSQDLASTVKLRVTENKKLLIKIGVEFAIFEPTATGLKKSIIDATQPMRTLFELENYHHYYQQSQGGVHKKIDTAKLVTPTEIVDSRASFYRPETKKGDPRMWFGGLPSFAEAGDQIAVVIYQEAPYLFNLSKYDLSEEVQNPHSLIGQFLCQFNQENPVAIELLDKLKEIAGRGWIVSGRAGDTGVGYTVEKELGKEPDSSKQPDYKGIELKAGRGSKNRSTLFAQVADWSVSPCKRSADILNRYGYERDGDFKLYCSVSTRKPNSQGLILRYNEPSDCIEEWYEGSGSERELVAIWPGSLLRSRLREKHAETFWIEAASKKEEDNEYFQLISATHTREPLESQLMPLIAEGTITMDHLIKRNGKTNRVSEKGPLFKINKRDLDLLFPEPIKYKLK